MGSWRKTTVIVMGAVSWLLVSAVVSRLFSVFGPRGETSAWWLLVAFAAPVLAAFVLARVFVAMGASPSVWIGVAIGQALPTAAVLVLVVVGSAQLGDATTLVLNIAPLVMTLAFITGAAYLGARPDLRGDFVRLVQAARRPADGRPDTWD